MKKQVIIVKPKTLSVKDKEALVQNGDIVIEHPFPGDVRIVTPIEETHANHIRVSALKAIAGHGCDSQAKRFVENLVALLNVQNV